MMPFLSTALSPIDFLDKIPLFIIMILSPLVFLSAALLFVGSYLSKEKQDNFTKNTHRFFSALLLTAFVETLIHFYIDTNPTSWLAQTLSVLSPFIGLLVLVLFAIILWKCSHLFVLKTVLTVLEFCTFAFFLFLFLIPMFKAELEMRMVFLSFVLVVSYISVFAMWIYGLKLRFQKEGES